MYFKGFGEQGLLQGQLAEFGKRKTKCFDQAPGHVVFVGCCGLRGGAKEPSAVQGKDVKGSC